ncbi:hypothetical protein M427DRAFT_60849 [Gonapodya prolifera JEL478]|uniref:Uncharacterized protein n=1 Tax=Gonapodya prolifera (strain JEL478) TaxID=1344416 RepID=A0A139A397_GONPJ|nr:hypothetical protein M427DRAFT_60849 [Gonapodya prolifera JEL478]|eukprot:KXS11287.1 hypothetical protein M427DRAFT_60849 [Gonapodya prolifera JEL478]
MLAKESKFHLHLQYNASKAISYQELSPNMSNHSVCSPSSTIATALNTDAVMLYSVSSPVVPAAPVKNFRNTLAPYPYGSNRSVKPMVSSRATFLCQSPTHCGRYKDGEEEVEHHEEGSAPHVDGSSKPPKFVVVFGFLGFAGLGGNLCEVWPWCGEVDVFGTRSRIFASP